MRLRNESPPNGESGIGEISTQVAEQPVAVRPSGIKALSDEHPEETFVARRIEHVPIARSKARPRAVTHVGVNDGTGREAIDAPLTNGGGTLHPGPLAALIVPDIAERAIADGIIAFSAVHPEMSAEVGPSPGTPTHPGNIGGSSNAM